MKYIRIIGIGSPFGDDQAGWRVIEYLQQQEKNIQESIQKKIHLHRCDRPYFNLLELLHVDQETIIIDAMKMGIEIGLWRQLTFNDLKNHSSKHISTHGFGIIEALEFAKFFEQLPRKIQIYGIEIANLQGFEISSLVTEGAAKLSQHIMNKFL